MNQIRDRSLEKARDLGYPVNPDLPLLDDVGVCRGLSQATDRFLCLYAMVASSYGYPKEKALSWLTREGVSSALAESEHSYLNEAATKNQDAAKQWQVEGLWALAWCLSCHDDLDFSDSCSDDFIQMLPDISKNASTKSFRGTLKVRGLGEFLEQLDLAYCLHWAIREAEAQGQRPPGQVPPNVVVERRRALEWMAGEGGWDEVSLDT